MLTTQSGYADTIARGQVARLALAHSVNTFSWRSWGYPLFLILYSLFFIPSSCRSSRRTCLGTLCKPLLWRGWGGLLLPLLLCTLSTGLFASTPTSNDTLNSQPHSTLNSQHATENHTPAYTFSDFFDALDLPTVLGAGITPNGIEGATFNSSMRLAWRHHKGYGTYVFIGFDTHSNTYDSLSVAGTNVRSGEVWYYEIGMGLGYRIPLVKDIREYYAHPCFNKLDFFAYIQPGISIPYVKTVVPYRDNNTLGGTTTATTETTTTTSSTTTISSTPATDEASLYALRDHFSIVPTLRFGAGIEWFIVSNFGVFAEVSYIQHLTPTIIEQAAIDKGTIRHPSGPIVISIGLSLFFK